MILLPVDEAYAFDYYAILCAKSSKRLPVGNIKNMVWKAMKDSCPRFEEILESPEFAALLAANEHTFDMVEKAIKDECKASEVDAANCLRMKAKAALQAKFFGGNLTEFKTARCS